MKWSEIDSVVRKELTNGDLLDYDVSLVRIEHGSKHFKIYIHGFDKVISIIGEKER